MKIVMVCSLNDPAGTNIKERLLDAYPFETTSEWFDSSPVYSCIDKFIVSARKDVVFVEKLDEAFSDCTYVFISRHRAESGKPSLTAHFTGNFGNASFGGNSREIAMYSPRLLKNYLNELISLRKEIDSSYTITLEATHHGPTSLHSPVLFVELGSTEKKWKDVRTAKQIAKALMSSLDSKSEYAKCAIAIGGTHYPEKLNRIVFDSELAIGTIIPKYALQYLDKQILAQMISKSDQKVNAALIDRKGLGKYKQAVLDLLGGTDLEQISI